MIKKINKIKKLGLVFSDYSWDTNLANFKQFNLFYGWNGTGKTTFSRLFDAISGVSIPNLEYEIEDEGNTKYKQNEPFPKKIRVFNQDYILNNIKILESRANSISILLGEENKDLVEKIEADKKLLEGDSSDLENPGKSSVYSEYLKDKIRKTTERNGKFTEIAKTIGAVIGGNALRDYKKPQAEKDFIPLSVKAQLKEDELEKYSLSVRQESLPVINLIDNDKIKNDDLDSIIKEANALCIKTVESEIIPRLAENEDISDWVEQGIHLHDKYSSDICEYCLQKIPSDRVKQLMRHFNEADKKLKGDLDLLVRKLGNVQQFIHALTFPDRARFYVDLQGTYDVKISDFESAREGVILNIKKLIQELENKKSKTTESIKLSMGFDIKDFSLKVSELNKLIDSHNKITSDFDNVKKDAIQKLKLHYLSTIFDDVKRIDGEIIQLRKNIELLEAEIADIKKRISENMAKISSDHKACEAINKKLSTFLGHEELSFVPDTNKEIEENGEEAETINRYRIMRGENPANYLSEGEKTAIAFIYFVVHLEDGNFNVADGIIVIDDPISSLDSNSLYQAFSFLKNAVKEGGQIFILTHSFDFLKLLINWRRGDRSKPTGYYMIKNNFPDNIRCAYIDKMDKELSEYESEYHYLFKLLKQLRIEQDDSIAKAYPVPNIARKVWDTFLMFSVPNGQGSYKKMDELKEAGYDEQKLDAIYKFTNDQSHITGSGFNPALVQETKKVINELFEMMEAISPNHFKIIDKATN